MAKVRFADGSRSIGGIPVKKTTGSGRGTFFNRMKWATLVVVLGGVVGGVPVPNPNPAPAPAHFEPSGPNVPGFGGDGGGHAIPPGLVPKNHGGHHPPPVKRDFYQNWCPKHVGDPLWDKICIDEPHPIVERRLVDHKRDGPPIVPGSSSSPHNGNSNGDDVTLAAGGEVSPPPKLERRQVESTSDTSAHLERRQASFLHANQCSDPLPPDEDPKTYFCDCPGYPGCTPDSFERRSLADSASVLERREHGDSQDGPVCDSPLPPGADPKDFYQGCSGKPDQPPLERRSIAGSPPDIKRALANGPPVVRTRPVVKNPNCETELPPGVDPATFWKGCFGYPALERRSIASPSDHRLERRFAPGPPTNPNPNADPDRSGSSGSSGNGGSNASGGGGDGGAASRPDPLKDDKHYSDERNVHHPPQKSRVDVGPSPGDNTQKSVAPPKPYTNPYVKPQSQQEGGESKIGVPKGENGMPTGQEAGEKAVAPPAGGGDPSKDFSLWIGIQF